MENEWGLRSPVQYRGDLVRRFAKFISEPSVPDATKFMLRCCSAGKAPARPSEETVAEGSRMGALSPDQPEAMLTDPALYQF